MGDDLGDRMKAYEEHETGRRFLPGLPVYARMDGRAFHGFALGLRKPYDERLSRVMIETARSLVEKTHAAVAYTQSDEISLAFEADHRVPRSSYFFDGKTMKMASVLASLTTALFTRHLLASELEVTHGDRTPHFDARVIQMPGREEVANMFLWRELDATKNAVSAAARSVYSHAALHGQGRADMMEMLHQKGINFNDYPPFFKRGTYLQRRPGVRPFTAEELERIPPQHRPEPGTLRERHDVVVLDLPPLGRVENRVGVLFDREDPRLAAD